MNGLSKMIIALLMAVVFVLFFLGCGRKGPPVLPKSTPKSSSDNIKQGVKSRYFSKHANVQPNYT